MKTPEYLPPGEPRPHTPPPIELKWLKHFSRLTDDLFRIPGTKLRFGLDPLLGLIPWVGDFITGLTSAVFLVAVARRGVSSEILLRMTGNILLDYLLGSIPFIGDLFDFGFQANRRNLRLLERHWNEGKHNRNEKKLILIAGFILFAIISVLGYLFWRIIRWIWDAIF